MRLIQRFRRAGFADTLASVMSRSPLMRYVDQQQLRPEFGLTRLGTMHGGWIIPADHGLSVSSVCYSAGAGEDISFDCLLAQQYGCTVRIVDPTPRAIAHFEELGRAVSEGRRFAVNKSATEFYDVSRAGLDRLTFLPVGLSDRDTTLKFYLPKNPDHVSCSTVNLQGTEDFFTAPCHRLKTLMDQQGDRVVDLLKMDIEGAEYMIISDLVQSNMLPRILLIEFDEVHTPLDNGATTRIQDHVDKLVSAGMTPIAVEGSNMTLVGR